VIGRVGAGNVRESFVVDSEILANRWPSVALSAFASNVKRGGPVSTKKLCSALRISCPETGGIVVRVVRRRSLSNECKTFRGVVVILD